MFLSIKVEKAENQRVTDKDVQTQGEMHFPMAYSTNACNSRTGTRLKKSGTQNSMQVFSVGGRELNYSHMDSDLPAGAFVGSWNPQQSQDSNPGYMIWDAGVPGHIVNAAKAKLYFLSMK